MANDDEYLHVRIKKRIAHYVANFLRWASVEPHWRASQEKDPNKARELRQDAEDLNDTARDIDEALGRRTDD